ERPATRGGLLRAVAATIPFLLAVSRAASSGQWQGDRSAIRDFGLVPTGVGGSVSTVLTQALALVPLGPRAFRAAPGTGLARGAALGVGAASYLLYGIALAALENDDAAPGPRGLDGEGGSKLFAFLGPVLACMTALTAGLSPAWQKEGTVGGGSLLGAALA